MTVIAGFEFDRKTGLWTAVDSNGYKVQLDGLKRRVKNEMLKDMEERGKHVFLNDYVGEPWTMSEIKQVDCGPRTWHLNLRPAGDANMSDNQLKFIERLALDTELPHFLEVGAYKGTTTKMLAKIGDVVAIDWFRGNEEAQTEPNWHAGEGEVRDRTDGFKHAITAANAWDKVTILCGTSDDVLPMLRYNWFGLVLIDANHAEDFCYRDIKNTWDTLIAGGWLLLDDWTMGSVPGKPGTVRRAWERFATERGLEKLDLFTPDDSVGPKLVAVQKP